MVAARAWIQCGSLGWRGALVLLGGGPRHGAPPPPPLAPPPRGNGHGGDLCGRHTHRTSSLIMAQKAFSRLISTLGLTVASPRRHCSPGKKLRVKDAQVRGLVQNADNHFSLNIQAEGMG